ncbi:SDR family oxidoreductase [Streptomyces platensis]|uniref:SDR family oxidoreductase n=1 Tax=Streptomyces platensis TaxID=58346 RepID=UPI001F2B27F5|nr:SDR family oxidoreductase [Streptomyces platensis]MCF3145194.1 SDR family oxidoreductase [Streptomyces platensis]
MNLFDLSGKVALVTGGTRGIGKMIARGLLEAGARVYVVSRGRAACDDAERELSAYGQVTALAQDVSTEAAARALAETIGAAEQRLDILVNNAGAHHMAPMEEHGAEDWHRVLGLNVEAPFFLTRSLLDLMAEAATEGSPARVINVGSIAGLHVPRGLQTYAYSTSKAAVHHLTRVLAWELAPRNVTVNAIAPGVFPSEMTTSTLEAYRTGQRKMAPLGRVGSPEDMAGAAVYLASRAGAYVTGTVIPVDGGLATTV